MSLVVLGDIHFRDDKDYFVRTCEEFLKWFGSWELNNPSNSLILAGDLVETSLLTGNVADYLERFVGTSRFSSINICVGNHDKKKFHNEDQLAYEFFKNKPNVNVFEKAAETMIDGRKVLMLPYYLGLNCHGQTMSEYYSGISRNKLFSNDYDLVVGHFCGEDMSYYGGSDCVRNLGDINAGRVILGHIHTRMTNPDVYIGSVFAGKKNENDCTRSALVLDDNGWREERLPLFNEFLSVNYPNDLPPTNAIVPIYTVLNCSSESAARSRYGDIYIKRTTTDDVEFSVGRSSDMDRQFSSIKNMDMGDLFRAFTKSQEIPMDREVLKDCHRLLGLE